MSEVVPNFHCSICGGTLVTAVIKNIFEFQTVYSIQVPEGGPTYIDETDSQFDYMDAYIDYFCCRNCGEAITWADGTIINNAEQLLEWCQAFPPPTPVIENITEIE